MGESAARKSVTLRRVVLLGLVGVAAVLAAGDLQGTSGWPDRATSATEAEALDALAAVGGSATAYFTSRRIHVEFREQCFALGSRRHVFVSCGNALRRWSPVRKEARATDADLQHLRAVPHIIEVNLCGTATTDAAIEVLRDLSDLQYVTVFGTAITPSGVARLLKEKPQLEVQTTDPIGFDREDELERSNTRPAPSATR